jgi:hypothetical protein
MTDNGKNGGGPKVSRPPRADDRQARLAAAMRANLKRRKAQQRARGSADDVRPEDAAEGVEEP